jgi:hypothetical protein
VNQMPDALTNISEFIIKPSAPFAAGVVLFGVVWGFFKGVESVLKDDTKLEIAIWLLGVKVGQKLEPWPETFAKVFDRVFGKKHLSWKCFLRSCAASYALGAVVIVLSLLRWREYFALRDPLVWLAFIALSLINAAIPDYVSLLETRYVLKAMKRVRFGAVWGLLICLDLAITFALGLFGAYATIYVCARSHSVLLFRLLVRLPHSGVAVLALIYHTSFGGHRNLLWDLLWHTPYMVFPAFFTSIWLWLYAGSGFLLKAARRFDIGFDWFNRKFDIEKKPLQSIGLVAGALVAVVYWAVVIVGRWV